MNPQFIFGNPIPPTLFINRTRELRRLASRITSGQSTAIIGEPRMGKTSILEYLCAEETRTALYGPQGAQMLFSFIDVQSLGMQLSQVEFWKQALQPLVDQVIQPQVDAGIAAAYQTCLENGFGTFVLERLFAQLARARYSLVLLFDEFNTLLHHPVLNSAEFFGGLRSLASRSRTALVLVIASRQPLGVLNLETQHLSLTGSPYFNFMDELILGPFSEPYTAELLTRAAARFNEEDRVFVARVAGGHPYLLQVVASALWDAFEDEQKPAARRGYAGEELFHIASDVISDTWRMWTPEMKKAFTAVSLDHGSILLGERSFDVSELSKELVNLGPELRALENQGYILPEPQALTGWRVRPEAFLWWLAEEIIRTVRDDVSFEEWISAQEWQGLVKKVEKDQLNKAAQAMGNMLKDGIAIFIKGASEGITRKVVGG